jgi:hypothetical protein
MCVIVCVCHALGFTRNHNSLPTPAAPCRPSVQLPQILVRRGCPSQPPEADEASAACSRAVPFSPAVKKNGLTVIIVLVIIIVILYVPQLWYIIVITMYCCIIIGIIWLVVYLPLWKIWVRQLGSLFPIYGKGKNVPNHQPVMVLYYDHMESCGIMWNHMESYGIIWTMEWWK